MIIAKLKKLYYRYINNLDIVEKNKFDSIKKIYWRNATIDFSSIDSVFFLINPIKLSRHFVAP